MTQTPDAPRSRILIDRRKPAADQIYAHLRHGIVRLDYKPREALFENGIAEQSGISRTPVRQALQRLRDEGLVEIFPGFGSFVAPLDTGRLREAVRIRELLEAEAAAVAALSNTAAQIGIDLLHIVDDQRRALERGDPDRVYELDADFHRTLFVAANLPTMWGLVSIARANMDRVHYLSRHLQRGQLALDFHHEIASAIKNRDAPLARDAMQRHINSNASVVDDLATRHPHFLTGS